MSLIDLYKRLKILKDDSVHWSIDFHLVDYRIIANAYYNLDGVIHDCIDIYNTLAQRFDEDEITTLEYHETSWEIMDVLCPRFLELMGA
jgi:hypothetical protein